jgi:hypothetical protein
MSNRRSRLKLVTAPSTGHVVSAPPAIELVSNTIYYTCGLCETVLLKADPGQVHGVLIHCLECGSYNAVDL